MRLSSHLHPALTAETLSTLRAEEDVTTIADFLARDPIDLVRATQLHMRVVDDIRLKLFTAHAPRAACAYDLLLRNHSVHISTGIPALDKPGFRTGRIYEVYGPPGVGKTQLMLTLTAQCALAGSGAVYLDTKNDFFPDRLGQIIKQRKKQVEIKKTLDLVLVKKLFLLEDLVSTLQTVRMLYDRDPFWKECRLLVLDSVAAVVLPEMTGEDQLTRLSGALCHVRQLLKELARRCGMCVVVVNHATTRGEGVLKPSLGKMFSAAADVRLLVERVKKGEQRRAVSVVKGGEKKKKCFVQIASGGWVAVDDE